MIKQCQRCGADFDAKTRAKYCVACRPVVHKEQVQAGAKHWRAEHRDKAREIARRCYAKHKEEYCDRQRQWYLSHRDELRAKYRSYYHKKQQIAKLRAKLQAAAAKRQAELERQQKYYRDPPSMFDGVGVPIPSSLANLGRP